MARIRHLTVMLGLLESVLKPDHTNTEATYRRRSTARLAHERPDIEQAAEQANRCNKRNKAMGLTGQLLNLPEPLQGLLAAV